MKADEPATEIRLLAVQDVAELTRLADLDTADPPPQPLLGATVDGRLVAAHSLATDESIADPFQHTADIRSLLARRARQLRDDGPHRGLFRRIRRRRAERARRAHALRGGIRAPFIPGSEHTHMVLPPKAY